MIDREKIHRALNEKFPRFAQHLPFDQRDGIVREVEAVLGAEKDAEVARLRAELNNVTIIHPDGAETKARRLF